MHKHTSYRHWGMGNADTYVSYSTALIDTHFLDDQNTGVERVNNNTNDFVNAIRL